VIAFCEEHGLFLLLLSIGPPRGIAEIQEFVEEMLIGLEIFIIVFSLGDEILFTFYLCLETC
jgi:hypothetical protein